MEIPNKVLSSLSLSLSLLRARRAVLCANSSAADRKGEKEVGGGGGEREKGGGGGGREGGDKSS